MIHAIADVTTITEEPTLESCPFTNFTIQGREIWWPETAVGETVTAYCGRLYSVAVTRVCQANYRWFPDEAAVTNSCHQNLAFSYIRNVIIYGLSSVAVIFLTLAAVILRWAQKRRGSSKDKLRLYFFLILEVDISLVVGLLSVLIPKMIQHHDQETYLTICIATKVTWLYFNESLNYWLLNIGIFLYLAVLHPLRSREIPESFYHVIGWASPLVTLMCYFLAISTITRGDLMSMCFIPDEIKDFTLLIELPSIITYVANLFFVVAIVRVMTQKIVKQTRNIPMQLKHGLKNYVWLFTLLGQWKIFDLVPVWRLSNAIAYHYVNFLIFLTFVSYIGLTIPTCYCGVEVRALIRRHFERRNARKNCELGSHRRS